MSTARALYDYTDDPNNQHQLRFVAGDIVTVTEKRDDGWWGGILNGVEGFFPASYVQVLDEESTDAAYGSTDGAVADQHHTPHISRGSTELQPLTPSSSIAMLAVQRGSNERRASDGAFTASPMTPMADDENTTATSHTPTPRNNYHTPDTVIPVGTAVKGDEVTTMHKQTSSQEDDENISYWKRHWRINKKRRCAWLCGGFQMTTAQFFCLLCFICMLITLIVMLIAIYAIAPALVKQIVAKSKVKFDANTITNPRDDAMTIQASGMITDTGPFKAIIGAMTVTVSENRPDGTTAVLGSMPLAEQTVSGDTALNAFAEFSVINKPNFYAFAKSMIFNEKVSWHLEATTTITPVMAGIKLPAIPNIPFSKDLTLNAANGLQGVNLTSFDLTKSTPDSIVANIVVYIPNPSAFSIQPMGDLTFDLMYLGKLLGQVKAPNASLYFESVRRNEIFMSGIISPPTDALPAVAHMVNRYLTGLPTTVQAVAGPNASTIVAFARGMEGLTLDTIVPPLTIDLIQEMTFTKMGLTPHKTLPQADLTLSIDLRIYSPLGENSPMTINTMAMTSAMKFISKSGQLLEVGSLTITSTPVKTRCNPPKLACLLYSVNVSTTLMIAEGPAYGQFVTDFLAADTMQVYVVGTANVTATYALGDLAVSGIKVNAMANLRGLQGLNTTKVESLNIDGDWALPSSWGTLAHREVHALRTYASQRHDESHLRYHGLQAATPGLKGELVIIKASMINPSITTVNLPAWRMNIQYAASHGITSILGSVWPIDNPDRTKRNRIDLTLVPGLNTLYFMGFLLPDDAKAAGEFFSGYMDGQNFATTLVFPTNSTDRSAVAQTLSSMTLSTIVPGVQNARVLRGISVKQFGVVVNSKDTQSGKGQVTADFALPSNVNFPITIQSTSMEVDMTFGGVTMAKMTINAPVSQTPGAPGSGITSSLVINFAETLMRVEDRMKVTFNQFASDLMNSPRATVTMNGNATATTKSEMGILSFKVPFDATITLDGLNGFKDAMTIERVDIVGGSKDAIVMEIDIGIQNPSRHVTIDIPDASVSTISFDMKYTGVGYKADGSPLTNLPAPTGIATNIGTVKVTNFKLTSGRNTYLKQTATYRLLPGATDADRQNGREFLSRFVNQVPIIKIEVVGLLSTGDSGTKITFLDQAFREFKQGANVPGLPQKEPLIRRYMLDIWRTDLIGQVLPTKIRIANQFSTVVAITETDLTVYRGEANAAITPIASMKGTWTTQMEVPRQTTKVTAALPVSMNVFGAFGGTLNTLVDVFFKGGTSLSVMGKVKAKIGGPNGFLQELDFVSSQTPACKIALLDLSGVYEC